MIFYLKANRNNSYVVPNVKHWIDAVMLYDDAIAYILCDNPDLSARIKKEIEIDEKRVFFIESIRDSQKINKITESVCGSAKWHGAGQAHMTTHFHSIENKYRFFWNIDADDTFICLDPIRIVDMFKTVEEYCISNDVMMMSLDMWRSRSICEKWEKGDHWSLGVVFVNNDAKWPEILTAHMNDEQLQKNIMLANPDMNLDWYFTYLRRIGAAKIESFYVENMKFMHFYDYFINFPYISMFCQWKNGVIKYPILEYCFGSHFLCETRIAEDIVQMNLGVTDDEGLLALIAYCGEKPVFWLDLHNKEMKVEKVMKERNLLLMKNQDCNEMICWGAGASFERNIDLVKKAYDVKYVCDNNPEKWGKKMKGDVLCISPETLHNIQMEKNVFVIVLVDNLLINYQIIHQLINMNIKYFDHFDNWLDFVEGANT